MNTFRAWFIGFVWSIILPGLNQFFFFRYPSVTITGVRVAVLSFLRARAHLYSLSLHRLSPS